MGCAAAAGAAAVQVLAAEGVRVTATCRGEHGPLVRGLGAERVIDYEREDFTRDPGRYAHVFDCVGKSRFRDCRPLLEPGGAYLSSEPGPGLENLYLPLLTALRGGSRVKFPFPADIPASIGLVTRLAEAGRFRPVIDRTWPLEDIAEAYRYVETGRKVGNVVITVGHPGEAGGAV